MTSELPVPIGDGLVARVPFPMDEDSFDLLIGTLQLWKKNLVRAKVQFGTFDVPRQAVWRNKDQDKNVIIIGTMGEQNGETFYRSLDGTGIPGSQLEFTEPDEGA